MSKFQAATALSIIGLAIAACSASDRDPTSETKKPGTAPDGNGAQQATANGEIVTDTKTPPKQPGACAPSPSNYDVPGNNCDDDGDGNVDNIVPCDGALPVTGDAATFVRALGICKTATATSWGLVSAKYTRGYNTNAAPNENQHGILNKFGKLIKPREGVSLGILSTGFAREFDKGDGNGNWNPLDVILGLNSDAFKGGQAMTNSGALPPGYPKAAAGCDIANDVHDVASIELELKAPTNARGIKFDFNFFSGEWPEYVCTRFNDGFAAFLKSKAFNGGVLENMSFDAQNNPVSVNNGFFDRCTPNAQTGCRGPSPKTAACPGGEAELAGTGFEQKGKYCGGVTSSAGGATGWLSSQAPVEPGETISLHLVIWDTGDQRYDSSVLLDNVGWVESETVAVTERPK